jgi:hypothetical protein
MANAKPWEFRPKSYLYYVNPPKPGDRIAIHAASRPARLTEVDATLARSLSGTASDSTPTAPGRCLSLRTELRQPRGSGAFMARAVAPLGCVLGTPHSASRVDAMVLRRQARLPPLRWGDSTAYDQT